MQVKDIVVGEEYVLRRYSGPERIRVKSIEKATPSFYNKSVNHVVFDLLDTRTGAIVDDQGHHGPRSGHRVEVKQVAGLWKEYAAEILERARKDEEDREARAAHENRMRAALAVLGVVQEDYRPDKAKFPYSNLIELASYPKIEQCCAQLRLDVLERLAERLVIRLAKE